MTSKVSSAWLSLLCAAGISQPAFAGGRTLNVGCIGDSITYGAGLTTQTSYPTDLQNLSSGALKVTNYGASGTTLLKLGDSPYWNTSQFSQSTTASDDIYIIMLGTNDGKTFNWDPYSQNYPSDYDALIKNYQATRNHPTIYLCKCLPGWGTTAWSIDWVTESYNVVASINPDIDAVGASHGLQVIDTHAPFENHPEYFQSDGIHPTATGASILAQTIYNAVTNAPAQKPAAPTALTAVSETEQVLLNWPASFGATSYNVKRALSSAGPFTTIASSAHATYTDTGLLNGTAYYYEVTAVSSAGESAVSPQAIATPFAIPNGVYQLEDMAGYALDDPNSGGAGTGLDQQVYTGGTNQQWAITYVGNGQYEITSAVNGLALTSPELTGNQITLQPYTGANHQLWIIEQSGSNYKFVNCGTMNEALDDTKGGIGVAVTQWRRELTQPNQDWTIAAP